MSDYWKIVDVINSCKTSAQNNVAYRLVQLYDRKYPVSRGLAQELYDLCDENLIDICNKGGNNGK